MNATPMFNSVEDECRHWKEKAKLYHKDWTDVKQDYDEYLEHSRQVESEMDAVLDQKENTIKELRMKIAHMEKDNDMLKAKVETNSSEMSSLERQLESIRNERDSMKEYMRKLEQKNDDLERAHRILNESMVDFERMLDKAYEKNALLELEVDEKETVKEKLQEKLQRLMDETRDLKQELNVKTRFPLNNAEDNAVTTQNGIELHDNAIDNLQNSLAQCTIQNNISDHNNTTATATAKASTGATAAINKNEHNRYSFKNPDNMTNGNPMTASSRTTALNIVADMLRKLNAMETKLKTYREQAPPVQPRL